MGWEPEPANLAELMSLSERPSFREQGEMLLRGSTRGWPLAPTRSQVGLQRIPCGRSRSRCQVHRTLQSQSSKLKLDIVSNKCHGNQGMEASLAPEGMPGSRQATTWYHYGFCKQIVMKEVRGSQCWKKRQFQGRFGK